MIFFQTWHQQGTSFGLRPTKPCALNPTEPSTISLSPKIFDVMPTTKVKDIVVLSRERGDGS